jgi:ubiquinone/menaquinone biosynthesis C-methylase UbiE
MAPYYDAIYSKAVDYRSHADYLEKIFAKHRGPKKKKSDSILDIACGTGNYSFIFAEEGHRVTGIDLSDQMIQIARKKVGTKRNPYFLTMDMRKIELRHKYDLATVLFGGFGYLLLQSDVESFLIGVERCLNRDGLLVFEFWQKSALHPASKRPSGQTSWDRVEHDDRTIVRLHLSKYDARTDNLNLTFDVYVLDLGAKNLVDTFTETHVLRTYAISQV